MNTKSSSIKSIQSLNWEGYLPIELSLAPTSLSSPTMPPSIHKLIPRNNYLHLSLQDDINYFYQFAPSMATFSLFGSTNTYNSTDEGGEDSNTITNDDDDGNQVNSDNKPTNDIQHSEPTHENNDTTSCANNYNNNNSNIHCPATCCWFEDEITKLPLRWHLFIGVLYDLLHHHNHTKTHTNIHIQEELTTTKLPWKLRIHFTSYPSTLLSLSNSTTTTTTSSLSSSSSTNSTVLSILHSKFTHSLKQSFYIQTNSNRLQRALTKANYIQIWDGFIRNDYHVYSQVFDSESNHYGKFYTTANNNNNNNNCHAGNDEDSSIGINAHESNPSLLSNSNSNSNSISSIKNNGKEISNIPIRIVMNHQPMISKPCPPHWTLQDLFSNWLPDLQFYTIMDDTNDSEDYTTTTTGTTSATSTVNALKWFYCIQGVSVPLQSNMLDLWIHLCHPDRFLYIIVSSCSS